ncbi:hypothetical protein VD0002_g9423 [Verticillium dahliae]|uniref:Uncharacterized protein n=1 Tax=Verticillium dahliae TaxID=27337 RepID=A0A2J8C514_VERDA|nr:hypothetical protein BJF96_g4466 [Verticillium dahliae]PNH38156.1 hypothetical protein VD0004_g8651 [Verticillium dahliae]PNH57105.1 hypothetical protein VD0003_g659 [Verticillium dahliae]PNH58103.1 hypothetical protein VD0002_g9423 [Verticillium dahliae]PNH68764.1 hypothetical protein VD0001_g7393 [Verticillium dahliae]
MALWDWDSNSSREIVEVVTMIAHAQLEGIDE